MPDNDSIKTNKTPQYPYIMKQDSKQQNFKMDWDKALKSPIDFKFPYEGKNDSIHFQYVQDEKTIGDYLNKKYSAKPDALKVAKPNADIEIQKNKNPKLELKGTKVVVVPDVPTNYPARFNVTKNMFNGSVEDLNRSLKGTKLEGMGQIFMDAQEKYGINAIFLMGIVSEESTFGAAPAKERNGKVHKYNIAGLKTGKKTPGHIYQDNTSYQECIETLCKNLHKHYISRNKTTIQSIQTVYAPGNKNWTNKIRKKMNEISQKIMEPYQLPDQQKKVIIDN